MSGYDDPIRRRLWIRSIRRGMKEMDVILTGFANSALATMSDEELTAYEAFLQENDQSLFAWLMGQEAAPPAHLAMVQRIQATLPGSA